MIDPSYAHAVSAAILLVVVWGVAYVAYIIGTQQKTKGMIETYKERDARGRFVKIDRRNSAEMK